MNPLEILQKTPKNNCRKCGHLTCLAFAAAVSKTGEDPAKCPFINPSEFAEISPTADTMENIGKEHDLALIKHLKGKIAGLNFEAIAPKLGITLLAGTDDTLSFKYLGQETVVNKIAGITIEEQEPNDPRDQILLYNYIHASGGRKPAGNWIGLESLPNSISKIRTLARYSEEPIAELFSNIQPEKIIPFCQGLDAFAVPESTASLAFTVPVLPMLPLQLLFWGAEPEDGFGAKVKILFDEHVLDFLDLESLVFTAERLSDTLHRVTG